VQKRNQRVQFEPICGGNEKVAISPNTQKLLSQLAELFATETNDFQDDILGTFRTGRIPKSVAPDNDDPGWLIVTGDTFIYYEKCLDALAEESELEHITRSDINPELWEFVCDISSNWQSYQKPKNRNDRIRDFLSALVTPHKDFEVMFRVDGLRLTENEITTCGVSFYHLDEEKASGWGIRDQVGSMQLAPELIGNSVGLVPVKAGSSSKALERAKEKFETALNVLRVCISSFPMARIWDEQLLQKRGQIHAVKVLSPSPQVLPGWDRNFASIDLDLGGPLLQSTSELAAKLEPMFDGTIHGRLGAQFVRALEWIGTSITREHNDDKVVDLCTSLEALLTTKDDQRKGEAIALRIMLLSMSLGQDFFHPREVLKLYDLRSRVVHGSARGVCGRPEYLKLRSYALQSLLNVLRLIEQDSSVTRPSLLIKSLEREAQIEQAVSWLDQWRDAESNAIRDYANKRWDRVRDSESLTD